MLCKHPYTSPSCQHESSEGVWLLKSHSNIWFRKEISRSRALSPSSLEQRVECGGLDCSASTAPRLRLQWLRNTIWQPSYTHTQTYAHLDVVSHTNHKTAHRSFVLKHLERHYYSLSDSVPASYERESRRVILNEMMKIKCCLVSFLRARD